MDKKPKPTVLVVDDTEATRYLVTRALTRAGYDVRVAVTGQEALRMAQDKPDLITLDVQLPDINGLEVCRLLKAAPETSAIPVLHISATYVQSSHKAYALEGGADGYLTHPVEEIVLTATVNALLRARLAETGLREAQLRLEKQVLELHEQKELREKFVTTLTHDLRNPLTAARMSAEFIARGTATIQISQSMAVRVMDNIDRINKMIEDLLDANRIRAGEKLPLQIEECDLGALARNTLETLAGIHGDRFVLDSKESLIGYWSPKHLRRVIENLGNNAVKYGSPDTPVTISIKGTSEQARILVHNSGNPLRSDEQAKLFNSFHRTASAASGVQVGWGLGLTLVRGVAEAHGGEVIVASSAEAGTTFTLTLPRNFEMPQQG